MTHTREVSLDGRTYTVTQFGATKGMRMLTRLTKLLGEPLGVFLSDPDADANKAIPVALRSLSDRLDEHQVVETVKDLLEGVRTSDGPLEFETHFAGRMGLLFKLLGKVLEVQYGDFFGALAAKGSGLQGAARAVKEAS